MMWNGGFAGAVIWIVVMLAVSTLIVVGVILLVRGLSGRRDYGQAGYSQGPPPAGAGPKTSLQILEERYARGEIDREEFLQRRRDITGG
jgi:putative membrane protein